MIDYQKQKKIIMDNLPSIKRWNKFHKKKLPNFNIKRESERRKCTLHQPPTTNH